MAGNSSLPSVSKWESFAVEDLVAEDNFYRHVE